ncbi:DUF4132 domain-containing protein [Dactylosporangium sp. NPDC049140]|uniref:DUF4132 domain-containing protein n=1 Tax=Dactylosporangium sp. NPDC049140 TaxID=3155647 RepID=UPI00340AC85E
MSFVIPASWRRTIYPYRGGPIVAGEPSGEPPPEPSGAARVLEHPGTPDDVRAAGLAALGGAAADPEPLGVAAVWMAHLGSSARGPELAPAVGEHWVARHGPVLAARIGAEFAALGVAVEQAYSPEHGPQYLMRLWGAGAGSTARLTLAALGPVRAALAGAPDDVYAAAVEALRAARPASTFHRIAACFLVPTERDWVEQDVAALTERHSLAPLLMASIADAAQARSVKRRQESRADEQLRTPALLRTLTVALGDGILDVYAADWDGPLMRSSTFRVTQFLRDMAEALAAVPTDRAFQALVDKADRRGVQAAIEQAAERYPDRAMRLLDAARDKPRIPELLRRHAARHPGLAPGDLRPGGPPAGAAPADALPAVLVVPPWTTKRPAAKRVVLDLTCTDGPAAAWPPGERERLVAGLPKSRPGLNYAEFAQDVRAGNAYVYNADTLFREGPDEMVRPLLGIYQPRKRSEIWWVTAVAARFGADAYPLVLRMALLNPGDAGVLMPYSGPEIALLVADWLDRLKSARKSALAWLRAHPAAAARALIPAALGREAQPRRAAGRALTALAAAGHRDEILAAAAGYGPPATAAVTALVDADPLLELPARIPVPPEWTDAAALPPVRLRDGAGTLPPAAVGHLLTMLMISKPGSPYAGIAVVRAACDEGDLARLGLDLLRRWEAVDAPPADGWALEAQALLGDDDTAAALAGAVQRWPYEGAHKRAAAGLDTLARLGTEAALRELCDISTKAKAKAVRARADANLAEVALALGLTTEQLADRLVPRLGLDPDATMVLDYGPRRFVGGFDEHLKPFVDNEDGTRRADLPAPAARDDAARAGAAQERWTAAKKGARKVATEQVRRLERAMGFGRRWRADELRAVLLDHPLLWPLARRLVWITGAPGRPGPALRIAEDRTFADVADEGVELPGDTLLGVAHPVDLDVAAWSAVFGDYGLLQPFKQLGRKVRHLRPDEAAAVRLARFDERKAMTVKLLGLERRGWRRAGIDGGYQGRMERDLPGGRLLIAGLDPGIMLGLPNEQPEQRLSDVWIAPDAASQWSPERTVPFSALDAASASEILVDLESCT